MNGGTWGGVRWDGTRWDGEQAVGVAVGVTVFASTGGRRGVDPGWSVGAEPVGTAAKVNPAWSTGKGR